MKKISADIVCDSLAPNGKRCTTFVLTFPRIVLAEFNTHRMISKNSSSSRAIPFERMVEQAMNNPFIPIGFQKKHKGMQGSEYFESDEDQMMCEQLWLESRDSAVAKAIEMDKAGITKQLVNRTIEAYLYHTVIATGTDWENFFSLRANDQAEIHIQALAYEMLTAYNNSTPKELRVGEWHIPFGDKFDTERLLKIANNSTELEEIKVKIATARCARVSYLNFEGKDDYEADLKLHDDLLKSGHFSPFEHCAKAGNTFDGHVYMGNFTGFVQYRKTLEGENRKDNRVELKVRQS